jgi:lysozyme
MKVGKLGIELIKHYEGGKANAYLCPSGIPTIGYGCTFYKDGTKVKMGDTITAERAEELLLNILPKFEKTVNKNIKIALEQHEFDALVSFCFNCGSSETLFKLINDRKGADEIYTWWVTHYVTGGGEFLIGLMKRRVSEAYLFKNGVNKLT